MKKSLCLFLALLLPGSACPAGAHCVINEKRDKVELTEHTEKVYLSDYMDYYMFGYTEEELEDALRYY